MTTPPRHRKAAVGRPASGGPIVVVRIDDRLAGWCDGIFTGDRDMVAAAYRAVRYQFTAPLNQWDPEVPADATTALGAAAALITLNSGRAVIERAPDDVLAAVAGQHQDDGEAPVTGEVF